MSACGLPVELGPAPDVIHFVYKNHRGEVRAVRIDAATAHLHTGTSAHYRDPQPLLTAWDLDRQEERTYAMRQVVSWGQA